MRLNNYLIYDELVKFQPSYLEKYPGNSEVIGARPWNDDLREINDQYLYVFDTYESVVQIEQKLPKNIICVCENVEHSISIDANMITVQKRMSSSSLLLCILDIIDQYRQWDERMTNSIINRKPLQDLMNIACEKLSNPIAIFDTSQTEMYHSENFLANYSNTIWENILTDGYTPLNYYTPNENEKIKTSFERQDFPFLLVPKRDPEHTHLAGPIKLNGHLFGSIGMVDINAPFTKGQLFLSYHIIKLIEFVFCSQTDATIMEEDHYYLLRLLNGLDIEDRVVNYHLGLKGWGICDEYYLLTFSFHSSMDSSGQGKAFIKRLKIQYPKVISCYYENLIIAVVRKSDYNILESSARDKLESFCESNYLRCGISNCFSNFMHVKYYYIQSKTVLTENDIQADTNTLYYTDYFIQHVIHSIDSSTSLKAMCNPKILSLHYSSKNNRQELLHCIYTYLMMGRNIADTARKLFIHRNTLLYRIESVSDYLGLNLNTLDENQIFQILLSCIIVNNLDKKE